jgi:hypothetical protein
VQKQGGTKMRNITSVKPNTKKEAIVYIKSGTETWQVFSPDINNLPRAYVTDHIYDIMLSIMGKYENKYDLKFFYNDVEQDITQVEANYFAWMEGE